jgi:hypothetical protein
MNKVGNNLYICMGEIYPPDFKTGLPTSVVSYSNHIVNKLNKGDPLAKGTSSPTDFWKYLETWGGMWMWKGIDAAQTTKRDLTWLVEGMKSNSLVWVTDGLYDQKRVADLSGGGWIIFCSKTGLWLTSTFGERSPVASSYRAEMLGLRALQPDCFWSSTRSRSGKLHCVATTREHLSYHLTPTAGYGSVHNTRTFCAASRQQHAHSQENSHMCMCMDIWTATYCGTNCPYHSSQIAYTTC